MKDIILGLKPAIDDLKNITNVYVQKKAKHLGRKFDEVKVGSLNPTEFHDLSCTIINEIEKYLNNSPPMSDDEKFKVNKISGQIKEVLCHGPTGKDEDPFSHSPIGHDENPLGHGHAGSDKIHKK